MMTMEFETREFNKRLKKFTRKSNISVDKVLKKTAFDVLSSVLRPPPYGRHPVDTGRARAGWYASIKGLGKEYNLDSNLKASSKVHEGKPKGSFTDHRKGRLNKYIELVNGVNYIVYLEYGWSDVAPSGMVRVSLRKMRGGKLPKRIGKEYRNDWRQYMSGWRK